MELDRGLCGFDRFDDWRVSFDVRVEWEVERGVNEILIDVEFQSLLLPLPQRRVSSGTEAHREVSCGMFSWSALIYLLQIVGK